MTNSFFFQNWEGDFRGDGIPFTVAEQVREVIEDQESLDAAIFRENDRDGYARAMDMHGILPPNPHTLQQLLNGTATVNPNTEETSDSCSCLSRKGVRKECTRSSTCRVPATAASWAGPEHAKVIMVPFSDAEPAGPSTLVWR